MSPASFIFWASGIKGSKENKAPCTLLNLVSHSTISTNNSTSPLAISCYNHHLTRHCLSPRVHNRQRTSTLSLPPIRSRKFRLVHINGPRLQPVMVTRRLHIIRERVSLQQLRAITALGLVRPSNAAGIRALAAAVADVAAFVHVRGVYSVGGCVGELACEAVGALVDGTCGARAGAGECGRCVDCAVGVL